MDFYFILFINVNIYIYLFFVCRVFTFYNIDFCILETFIIEMSFDDDFCTVYQVRGDLATFSHSQFSLQVFTFTFLYSVEADICNTWTKCQVYEQIDFVAFYLFGCDFNIREQSMTPVAFDSTGNIITRYSNCLPYGQS